MNEPSDRAPGGAVPPGLDSPPSQDERTWGMLAHLSAFIGLLIPFAGAVLAPWVVWLTWRGRSPFVGEQAKEALNFNLSVLIACLACWVLRYAFVGILLLAIAVFLGWLGLTLRAGIRASEGAHYRYPLSLRLVK
jgi:uncharacterized Tic20 family protein